MKKYLLLSLFVAGSAFAQAGVPTGGYIKGDQTGLMSGICGMPAECATYVTKNTWPNANNVWEGGPNAAGTPYADLVSKSDASDNTRLNAPTGKSIFLDLGDTTAATPTPIAQLNASGLTLLSGSFLANGATGAFNYGPGFVPTLVATPVAGTNVFQPGLNVVPTNAANNAGFLGAATPVPGQHFTIVNTAGASVRAKAAGGATLNGATAGGYIAIADKATVECYTQSATNQVCEQPVIPTPAGP